MLPAILAVHAWVLAAPGSGRGERRAALRGLAHIAGVLALYLAARFAALGALRAERAVAARRALSSPPAYARKRLPRVPAAARLPAPCSRSISTISRRWASRPARRARSLAGLALFAAAAGALVWLLLRRGTRARSRGTAAQRRRRAVACALAIFLGFLFPVSHLLDFGALMAERFLFAPSLGFLLLAALAGAPRARAASSRLPARAAALPSSSSARWRWRARCAAPRAPRNGATPRPCGSPPTATCRTTPRSSRTWPRSASPAASSTPPQRCSSAASPATPSSSRRSATSATCACSRDASRRPASAYDAPARARARGLRHLEQSRRARDAAQSARGCAAPVPALARDQSELRRRAAQPRSDAASARGARGRAAQGST